MDQEPARIAALLALAALHLLAPALRSLEGVPRSRWLSAAGGISVAYVFVHLLPELEEGQRAVAREAGGVLPFVESHVYLLALIGFGVFYGVEVSSQRSRERRTDGGDAARRGDRDADRTSDGVFALSIASFAAYNGVIGYLVAREPFTAVGLLLFSVAIGLHFLVNDFSLREHHKRLYDRVGRFVVVGGIVAGWLVGRSTDVSEAAVGLMVAFIGGGVILNVIKEELPHERRSRFGAFALAAAAYAALVLAA